MSKPHIDELIRKFSGKVNMYILNADNKKVEEFMENFRIDGVPYFAVMIAGDMISGHKGVIQVDSDGGKAFFDDFDSYISIVFDVN
jgi:thioredoxin-like negative regulator of GroEL